MTDHVPLSLAALMLRKTYHRVRELVMRGELPGGRDARGHWYVERSALERINEGSPTGSAAAIR
jgi:hypothetical protein